ncbi:DNA primase [Geomesophilobacter sediminis]|uniref:DNA primase n=1 Tax=Geomesophilobacter sediminis TaxID=2798584 RepID=A0A8J7JF63_9BACT|nr:DNA primase [Geomesophilobacter sediminis]MBJ6724869.1 DNA primase [Geomesophilobacter sediminis]
MIADEKVREVRERASIVEVISEYMSLKKSGSNYQGLCPFHGEKTPSFNVNPARGIFHCFGCGTGGNVVTFVMRMEGMNFPSAVKFLAKRVGVEIPERPLSRDEKRQMDEAEILYRVNELAGEFYQQVLSTDEAGEAGRSYLKGRGVDRTIAGIYRMGFAPAGWDNLAKHLQRKGIAPEQAEKLGLLRRRDGGGFYDTFRNRLLFTIADLHGRTIGFGGRVMDDSLPKYINSPESPIYRKSEVLFGLDMAKKGMREKGNAIIVEGYFDHLALYRAGFTNVVATCGTALTPGHLQLLRRYAEKAYVLFDGDSAGRKATVRALDLFLEAEFPAAVVRVPVEDDPDTFLRREGAAGFAPLLDQAVPIFEFFYKDLLTELDVRSVEGKLAFDREVKPRLMKMRNSLERSLYEKEIAKVLGLDQGTMRRTMGPAPNAPRPEPRVKRETAGPREVLLSLMVKFPEVTTKVMQHGADRLFSGSELAVAQAIVAQTAQEGVDIPALLENIESPEERTRLSSLFVEDEHLEDIDPLKAFEQCRQTLERDYLKRVKTLARELAQVDPESPRYRELLAEIEQLRNIKAKLL